MAHNFVAGALAGVVVAGIGAGTISVLMGPVLSPSPQVTEAVVPVTSAPPPAAEPDALPRAGTGDGVSPQAPSPGIPEPYSGSEPAAAVDTRSAERPETGAVAGLGPVPAGEAGEEAQQVVAQSDPPLQPGAPAPQPAQPEADELSISNNPVQPPAPLVEEAAPQMGAVAPEVEDTPVVPRAEAPVSAAEEDPERTEAEPAGDAGVSAGTSAAVPEAAETPPATETPDGSLSSEPPAVPSAEAEAPRIAEAPQQPSGAQEPPSVVEVPEQPSAPVETPVTEAAAPEVETAETPTDVPPEVETASPREPVTPEVETAETPADVAPEVETDAPREPVTPEVETAETPADVAPEVETDAPREPVAPEVETAETPADVAPEVETEGPLEPVTPEVETAETPADVGPEVETDAPLEPVTPEVETAETPADEAPEEETATALEPEAPEAETAAPPQTEVAALPEEEAPQAEERPQVSSLIDRDSDGDGRPSIGTPARTLTDRASGVTTGRLPSLAAEPEAEDVRRRPVERFAERTDVEADKPLMSIVLIDDGNTPMGLEALESFPYPITFAVDTGWAGAAAAMRAYRDAGFEVMALANLPQGAQPQDAEVSLASALSAVPEAVAVLEGDAGGLQASRAVSDQVADILADSGHGLVLYPQGLNTAQAIAARAGVPAAVLFRDFDSKGQSATVIRRFLDQAAFKAGQEGAVIMLGRLRPETISALLIWGLQDRASRVAFVPVSRVLLPDGTDS